MVKEYETYGKIKFGKDVIIEKGAVLYGPLTIGDGTYIGRNSKLGYPVLGNLMKRIKEHGKITEGDLETVIGNNVFIDSDVMIYEDSKIGNNVKIFHHVTIREKVEIGDSSMIGCYTILDGPYIKIGKNTFIHAQAYICSKTTIGNQVFIGPQVGTINEKTAQSRIGLPSIKDYRNLEEGPTIGNNVSIGEGAHLMMGIKIGDKAAIGSGAMVTKDIPSGEIWVGNPAKKLKNRNF